MADIALGGVEKIVKVALAIKEAVETVKQNNKECRAIEKCATRCTALLKRLEEQTDTMEDEVMRAPLEDVAESLEEALQLVTLCQRKHYFSHLWKAGDMAKELRRVQDDILRKVQVGDFATTIQTTIMLTNIQNARAAPSPPPLPPPPSEEVVPGFTRFSSYELRIATKDFSDENIIGRGGHSTVYKGVLHHGQEVAIKKIDQYSLIDTEILYDAIKIFINLEHKNIIRPMGYCHEVVMALVHHEDEYLQAEIRTFHFVEEYMPKGSMESLIWSGLNWSSCFRIIQGIAQGVHYLHEQRVVHLDLKPGNILLGSDMNPRISDFGTAAMLEHVDDEITRDESMFGTLHYMAPEYITEGIISIKSDVFAFGVILFQTISSVNRLKSPDLEDSNVWAEVSQDAGRVEDLIDLAKFNKPQQVEIKRRIEIGLLCTRRDRSERPTMADVLLMLSGEKEPPVPKKSPAGINE